MSHPHSSPEDPHRNAPAAPAPEAAAVEAEVAASPAAAAAAAAAAEASPAGAAVEAAAVIRVRVIGVGGAGSNAVDRLVADEWARVDTCVVNTDAQALNAAVTADKLLVGRTLTRGLSTGGDPELGRKVAQKDREQLAALVQGQDLVFIVAGLGGGTGSAIAPVLAQLALAQGALVIGLVTLPFEIEGQRKHQIAQTAIGQLRGSCDALLWLPNDLLMQHMEPESTVLDAFAQADMWMVRAIQSVSTMVLRTGIINLDLAALRTAFENGGRTLFGLGRGQGRDCVEEALNDLLICPLLNLPEHSRRADRLLLNVIGGRDLNLAAINRILTAVTEHFGSREHTVLGAVIDERLEQSVQLCVIGTTSLENNGVRRRPAAVPGRLPQAATFSSAGATAPVTAFGSGGKADLSAENGISAPAAAGADAAGGAIAANALEGADTSMGSVLESQGLAPEAEGSASASASATAGDSNLFARDEDFPGTRPPAADSPRVHESKLKQRKKREGEQRPEADQQEEFRFVADDEQRGIFEKTERNLFEGEDLDVPTYLRRNLRIALQ